MPGTPISATYRLGENPFSRMGYGAMQLAGKGVFGPVRDRAKAIAVLREAFERASIISTPVISMARISPTRSSGKPCISMPIRW
ncbi:hypothetical protein HGG75_24605 [Ochrobactrum pseudogrignonense]|nr:hypothetical protein [Brucella pseudogrignonensis]